MKKWIVVMCLVMFLAVNVGPAIGGSSSPGPAPNSGDGIPDGSGFDEPPSPGPAGPPSEWLLDALRKNGNSSRGHGIEIKSRETMPSTGGQTAAPINRLYRPLAASGWVPAGKKTGPFRPVFLPLPPASRQLQVKINLMGSVNHGFFVTRNLRFFFLMCGVRLEKGTCVGALLLNTDT